MCDENDVLKVPDVEYNGLDHYLDDLYETVIRFPIDQREVDFIQAAVESMVGTLCSNIISSTDFKNRKSSISGRYLMAVHESEVNVETTTCLNNDNETDRMIQTEFRPNSDVELCRPKLHEESDTGRKTSSTIYVTQTNELDADDSLNDVCGKSGVHGDTNTHLHQPLLHDSNLSKMDMKEKNITNGFKKCVHDYSDETEVHTHGQRVCDMTTIDEIDIQETLFTDGDRNCVSESIERETCQSKRKFANKQLQNGRITPICADINTLTLNHELNKNNYDKRAGFEYKLLKVGSFYERTKNIFPDEFDFLVLLGDSYKTNDLEISLLGTFHNLLQTLVKQRYSTTPLRYCDDDFGFLVLEEHSEVHGPASKLKFTYYRCHDESYDTIAIHADVSPAFRLREPRNVLQSCDFLFSDWFVPVTDWEMCLLTFSIRKVGLDVTSQVSITEYEHYFMTNILSEQHRKVYQLVKYLINGRDIQEQVKMVNTKIKKRFPFYRRRVCGISSYAIKIIVFHHHYMCTNVSGSLSDCVLKVLQDLHTCFQEEENHWSKEYPGSIHRLYYYRERSDCWTLSTLTKHLILVGSSKSKTKNVETRLLDIINDLEDMASDGKTFDSTKYNMKPWSQHVLEMHTRTLNKIEHRQTCMIVCCLISVISTIIGLTVALGLSGTS